MTRLDYNLDCTSTKTPSSSVYETRSRLTLINGRDLITTGESTYWGKHIKVQNSRNLQRIFDPRGDAASASRPGVDPGFFCGGHLKKLEKS